MRAETHIGFHYAAELTQFGFTFEIQFSQNQPSYEVTG